jgi:hypothetical protein
MNATFQSMLSKFNRGHRHAADQNVIGSKVVNIECNKQDKILRFLRQWVLDAQDHIPEDVSEELQQNEPTGTLTAKEGRVIVCLRLIVTSVTQVHVDVASKREIWHLCCNELRDELLAEGAKVSPEEMEIPVSEGWFLKVLDDNYEIIIHRHKRFAQCVLCFMLKQMAARATTVADREHIKKHRGLHYQTVCCFCVLSKHQHVGTLGTLRVSCEPKTRSN